MEDDKDIRDQVLSTEQMIEGNSEWYERTKDFWIKSPATVSGMLGALPHVAPPDEKDSLNYLKGMYRHRATPMTGTIALDIGAGIGRVTEKVLLKCFTKVDIHDQNQNFLNKAWGRLSSYVKSGRLRNKFASPLQDFTPPEKEYDLIWIQWVIGYLPSMDLIRCLNRMKAALKPGKGVIVIKENCARDEEIIDNDDNYIIRSVENWTKIFNKSELHVVSARRDESLPKSIMPVYFFLLSPNDDSVDDDESEIPMKEMKKSKAKMQELKMRKEKSQTKKERKRKYDDDEKCEDEIEEDEEDEENEEEEEEEEVKVGQKKDK
ncbi:putative N-terminal Xaa-Pro-Lys N-methyltransferase 1 [Monocercomonoides exilis]|uniref:putative N-terminal Xaa-Pro-Lys N-methyltransferase 1 n=1 Tax=Monocercomonoides exilis TaxID=2049356 RepID=UPI00355A9FEB|nr:putative N-terminal Xaa-Pro-Lys N-methyltransferase 1 [Monocercomonoides exilis]